MKVKFGCIFFVTLALSVGQSFAKTNDTTTATPDPDVQTTPTSSGTKSTPITTTTQKHDVTTQSADDLCRQFNSSCSDCLGVSGAKCLWCNSDNSCKAYPVKKVLPGKDDCPLDEARWGVCWVNFEALIIGVSVTGGIIILVLTICICRCCCCRGNNKKYAKEEARYDSQKMERKAKNDERKAERKERLDEIRRKYGLMKDEPYQRFDA